MKANNRSSWGVAFALLCFTAYLGSGCVGYGKTGSGTVASETREVASFTALRLDIQNWRWAGVPFFIRTGKHLSFTQTELRLVSPHPYHWAPFLVIGRP